MLTLRQQTELAEYLAEPDAAEAHPGAPDGAVTNGAAVHPQSASAAAPAPAAAAPGAKPKGQWPMANAQCALSAAARAAQLNEIHLMRLSLHTLALAIKEDLTCLVAAQRAAGWPDLHALQDAVSALKRECGDLDNYLFESCFNLDFRK